MDERRGTGASPKLDEFEKRLAHARLERKSKEALKRKNSGFGVAFKIATDLVVAIVVGVGIGWILDSWLSTKPLFLLVFFLFGVAAGLLNVIRTAKKLNDIKP
jgi:ATP synthase protein I